MLYEGTVHHSTFAFQDITARARRVLPLECVPVSRLTLVVPCYNEEKRLDASAFRSVVVDGHEIDFLFVNDGSRDGTLRLLESLRDEDPKRFAVLNLERNSGKAEAVRRGFV